MALLFGLVSALRKVALGLLVVVLAACSQGSPEQLLSSARDYFAKGERATAIIQLKNLLQKSPDNGEARLLLGQAQLDSREFEAAEKELRRALELRQPHEKVLPLLARALYELGKFDDVVSEVQKRNLFDPPAVASAQTTLGDAYARLRQFERAKAAYDAALAAMPGYPRARLGQAIALGSEGKLDDAMKQVDEVIAADPKLAEAHAFKSDLFLFRGDRANASKSLEQALAANRNYVPARFSLISLLIDEKAFDKAAEQLDATRKIAPRDLRLPYFDGLLAFKKGDATKAREHVLQVLKFLPKHVPSLILAGAIEIQLNQLASAESYLRSALSLAPNHPTARRLLVGTYLAQGKPSRASDLLQPLFDQGMPKDPELLMLAGETFLAKGDVKQANLLFRTAASIDAQGAGARTRLGELALATGNTELGFKELETASELEAGKYHADLAIIAAHLRRQEFDKALTAVQALEKKQPKNPMTFQMYGLVHLAKRDVPRGREKFEKALELQPNYLPAAQNLATLDLLAKKPQDARKRYEAMIRKDPKNDQIYLALADLQARTGAEAKEIGATLQRAVDANPQSVPARRALVEFHLRNKDTKTALTVAQSAVAALSSEPSVIDALGVAQEAAGEINQAIETYNKLAAQQPQSVQPLYRLAALYVRQKDTDKAIESLRRVQKIAPRDLSVVPQLVQVHLAAKRPDDALKEARDLQKREPKFAGAYALEGDIFLAQRKFEEAERPYREALKLDPKANAVAARLHEAFSAGGKKSEADGWAKKWIADNPKDAGMRLYLGEREIVAKNLKAAAAHFQAVIGIDQDNVRALNNLAWIGGELADPKAVGYAERAVKLAPNNAEVLDTYGMLLVKNGEAARGLPYLEQAHKLAPTRNTVRLNYAKGLIKVGKKADARRELEALQSVKEEFPGKAEVADLIKGL